MDRINLHSGKIYYVGIGVLSVSWRKTKPRPYLRGFSHGRAYGSTERCAVPASGNANSVRPATRDWRSSGQVNTDSWRPAMSKTNTHIQINRRSILAALPAVVAVHAVALSGEVLSPIGIPIAEASRCGSMRRGRRHKANDFDVIE